MKKIQLLSVSNVIGIEEIEVQPGHVTVIKGKNGLGKSSILKSIQAAFQSRGMEGKLVHGDAEQGEVRLILDDGTKIERKIKQDGTTTVNITNADGDRKAKPQTILDELVGSGLNFNPVDFLKLSGKERRDLLLRAVNITVTNDDLMKWFGEVLPVDTSKPGIEVLENCQRYLYEQRKTANAVVKEREQRVNALASQVPAGFDISKWDGIDVSSLSVEIAAAGRILEERNNIEKASTALSNKVEILKSKKEQIKQRIADLENELNEVENELSSTETELVSTFEQFVEIEVPDIEAAQKTLKEYTQAQAIIATIDAGKAAKSELDAARVEAENRNKQLEVARNVSKTLLSQSNVPIDGLSITEDDILLNGIPVDNLSTSEQVRLALDIVRAQPSQLGIILVDCIESLDSESLAEFLAQAEADKDHDYIVTMVSDETELTVSNFD